MNRAAMMLVAVAALASCGTAAAAAADCKAASPLHPEKFDVSYDLSVLATVEGNKPFVVDENTTDNDFEYTFSVCRAVHAVPEPCGTPKDQEDVGFQTRVNNTDFCKSLGKVTEQSFSFIDQDDPGIGVTVTYAGGEADALCQNQRGNTRSLGVRVYCDQHHHAGELPEEEKVVTEDDNSCEYFVSLLHYSGCPLQCLGTGAGKETLCSNQGICSLDHDAVKVRCFCYEGYCGDKCERKCNTESDVGIQHSGTSATPALEAVVIVLMLVLLAVAATWYWRSRGPAVSPDGTGPYGRLGNTGAGAL